MPLFYVQQVCRPWTLKGEQSGDLVGVIGLGRLGPESAHSRGWYCPSPSGRLTQSDKLQARCLRRRAGGCETKRPQNSSRPEHPIGALSCGAAEPPPASQAPSLPSHPLVNLSAGKAPSVGAEPNRPPPPALRSSPGLSLANLSWSWLLRQSRVLALLRRTGPRTVGVLPARVATARKEDNCPSLLSRRKPPYHPTLGSSLLHQELQSKGGMWVVGGGVGV